MSKYTQRRRRALALLSSAAIAGTLAACGGGGGSHSLPVSGAVPNAGGTTPGGGTPSTGSATRATETVTLRIPATKASAKLRAPRYVSAASAGIGLSAYQVNTPAPQSPQFTGALGSPYCIAQSDGSQLCSFPVAAPVGSDIIDVRLYDQVPTPTGSPQGHVLSHVAAPVTIAANATNTLNLTMGGVVAGVQFTSGQWLISGSTTEFVASIAALDASANVIVGDAPYDQPVTVSLTGAGASHLTIKTGAALTSPADNQLVVTWDGVPFTAAAVTISAGGSPGTSAFDLPLPAAVAQVPFTVPAQARSDVALGLDDNPSLNGSSGFLVVPSSTLADNSTSRSFFYAARNALYDNDLMVAALPDNSVAAAYEAGNIVVPNLGTYVAVEVDLAFSHAQTQLDGVGTTFFTDMCDTRGATGDGLGNLAVLGDLNAFPNCGIPNGASATIQPSSMHHTPLGLRRPSSIRRAAGGTRRTLGGGSGTACTIEVFASPSQAQPLVSLAPARRIVDGNLCNTIQGLAADPQGRFYTVIGSIEGDSYTLAVYDAAAYTSPTATVSLQGPSALISGAYVQSLAVDNLGRVAVLFNGQDAVTHNTASVVELLPSYPSLVSAPALASVEFDPHTAGLNAEPDVMTFDRYNNLWIAGNMYSNGAVALYTFPPFPISVPSGYSPAVGASTVIGAGAGGDSSLNVWSLTAFPHPMSQTQPVLPTPSPSPGP